MDCNKSLIIPKKEENVRTVEIEIPFDLLQYLSSEGSCIQSLCRICLTVQENMTCLFSSSPALHELLAGISSMQPQVDDGLPSQICGVCVSHVRNCHMFKEKCDKAEYTLKSLLKGEFPTKEEKSYSDKIKNESGPLVDEPEKYTENTAIYLIEKNGHSDYLNNRENTDDIGNTKEEYEIHEDIQYLESFSDGQSDSDALDIHKEEVHQKKKKEDNISDAKLDYEKGLADKNKSYFDSGQICAYCSKRFKTHKALGAHIKKRHSSEASCHPCPHCKEVFNSEHDLRVHSALHDKGAAWTCNKCSKEFKTRALLRRHIYRHMESKRFTCAQCGKAFVEQYALRRHARVHTGEQREKKHQCHICDKRYCESGLLAEHMTSHSGEKPWSCSECGKQFASARLLCSHNAVHSTRKPYECRYCDRRFRHESTRNTHHRTHTGEKPYVCAACGKTFIQNSNLRLHMRTHTGERPYACSACSRRFTSGSALKAHARTLAPERPLACNYCGKRFSHTNLKAHMRLHVGEKPYECNICPKKFITATRLRDHCRIHTGEKPFECSICAQKFTTKSHLRQHIKHHDNVQKRAKKPSVIKQAPKKDEKQSEGYYSVDPDQVPLEVTGELVVQSEDYNQTDVLVVNNNQKLEMGLQNGICLEGVTYVNDDDVMIMNEGGVSISSTSATLEGTTVKLYHIDQSLVQIHSTGAQVTISKITSKMTTNF